MDGDHILLLGQSHIELKLSARLNLGGTHPELAEVHGRLHGKRPEPAVCPEAEPVTGEVREPAGNLGSSVGLARMYTNLFSATSLKIGL